jgi:hypothetical protein
LKKNINKYTNGNNDCGAPNIKWMEPYKWSEICWLDVHLERNVMSRFNLIIAWYMMLGYVW